MQKMLRLLAAVLMTIIVVAHSARAQDKKKVQFKIVNAKNTKKVIGVLSRGKADGSGIVLWDFVKNEPNQLWRFVAAKEGWGYVENVNSETYLSIKGDRDKDGSFLVLWKAKKDKSAFQQWKTVAAPGVKGWYLIVNRATNRVVTAPGNGIVNGIPIQLSNYKKGEKGQHWRIETVSSK